MTGRLGTVFANEKPFPITRIFLSEGTIQVEVRLNLDDVTFGRTEAHIHDPEGNLVLTFLWDLDEIGAKAIKNAPAGASISAVLPLKVTGQASEEWVARQKVGS